MTDTTTTAPEDDDFKKKDPPTAGHCPNCGYCPHCGRSDAIPFRPLLPPMPTYQPPYSPWWPYPWGGITWTSGYAVTTGTTGITVSGCE